MRWFGATFFFFKHVGERAGADPLKLIFFSIANLFFEASHFFFKVAYKINLRRMNLLGIEGFCLGVKDDRLKLYDGGINFYRSVHVFYRLHDIVRRLKTAERATDRCKIDHDCHRLNEPPIIPEHFLMERETL